MKPEDGSLRQGAEEELAGSDRFSGRGLALRKRPRTIGERRLSHTEEARREAGEDARRFWLGPHRQQRAARAHEERAQVLRIHLAALQRPRHVQDERKEVELGERDSVKTFLEERRVLRCVVDQASERDGFLAVPKAQKEERK